MRIERERWAEEAPALDPQRLVFVDETGAKTNMTRRHGRSPRGQRARDHAPAGHWCTTTLVAAVAARGPIAPMLLDGPMDAQAFPAWLDQQLVPALREGDVVVMDNLACHKVAAVREAVQGAGARLVYLPPYSPDLNPIEKMWSKVKAILRDARARTQEALEQAVKGALDAVSASDIRGWFKSCGYEL